jgi:hypothetical protein
VADINAAHAPLVSPRLNVVLFALLALFYVFDQQAAWRPAQHGRQLV